MTYASLNATFNGLALAQDIPIGSYDWIQGGMHLISGDTGGHPAYGWRHDHLLSPAWVRAVIANYGIRGAYYDNAPHRQTDYAFGSRPVGWAPEAGVALSGHLDLGTGQTLWTNPDGTAVKVAGPDLEHFHISPLLALYDSGDTFAVTTEAGAHVPAKSAAAIAIRLLLADHAGMIRDSNYECSDRAASCLLRNAVQAYKRGLIDSQDVAAIAAYLANVLIPYWLKFKQPTGGKGDFGQVYNGLFWILPAIWDAYQLVEGTPTVGDQLYKILCEYSLRMQCLCKSSPHGLAASRVPYWPDDPDTLIPEELIEFPKNNDGSNAYYGAPWGYRAALVAAEILESTFLYGEAAKVFNQYKNDKSNKQWLVNAEGVYT